MKSVFAGLFLTAVASACSTIVEGTSQKIAINTTPPGASCDLKRQGSSVGHVSTTPGSAEVAKTKYDIIIECSKAGYAKTTYINKSDYAGASFGNIAAGGIVGVGIDAATGAQNKYESPVNIMLTKK